MTTTQTVVPFRQALREARRARDDMKKAPAARELGVEWMTYDMWEKGAWVPGDETRVSITSGWSFRWWRLAVRIRTSSRAMRKPPHPEG